MQKCSVGIKPTDSHVYFMQAFTFSVVLKKKISGNCKKTTQVISQIDVFTIYCTLPLYSVPYNAAEAEQACL